MCSLPLALGMLSIGRSSLNQGRNALFLEALRYAEWVGHDYEYVIIMDDDAQPMCQQSSDPKVCVSLFEDYLMEWQPAAGMTVMDSFKMEEAYGLTPSWHFDGLFNAHHKDTIPYVLPENTFWDKESWLVSFFHCSFS